MDQPRPAHGDRRGGRLRPAEELGSRSHVCGCGAKRHRYFETFDPKSSSRFKPICISTKGVRHPPRERRRRAPRRASVPPRLFGWRRRGDGAAWGRRWGPPATGSRRSGSHGQWPEPLAVGGTARMPPALTRTWSREGLGRSSSAGASPPGCSPSDCCACFCPKAIGTETLRTPRGSPESQAGPGAVPRGPCPPGSCPATGPDPKGGPDRGPAVHAPWVRATVRPQPGLPTPREGGQ